MWVQARQEELSILVVGADFVAASAKAVTYVLSIILAIGTKKSGRVTSPVQGGNSIDSGHFLRY